MKSDSKRDERVTYGRQRFSEDGPHKVLLGDIFLEFVLVVIGLPRGGETHLLLGQLRLHRQRRDGQVARNVP